MRYTLRGGGFYYAPHHYGWTRWGNWGWGCYGWWGGRYMPYRWGWHQYYGWGYWPWDVAVGAFILGAAASSPTTTTTTTTTTVVTGTPIGGVMTGTAVTSNVVTGTAVSGSSSPSSASQAGQVPPPGFGFPCPDYTGKGDVPEPPQAEKGNTGAPDDNKIPEGESTAAPDKISFDYSKPPSEIAAFQKEMKSSSASASSSSDSGSSGPVG